MPVRDRRAGPVERLCIETLEYSSRFGMRRFLERRQDRRLFKCPVDEAGEPPVLANIQETLRAELPFFGQVGDVFQIANAAFITYLEI